MSRGLPGHPRDPGAPARAHVLQGPGAMAAEEMVAPPRMADGRAWMANAVVAICLFATLWLGIGANLGALPGVSRVIDWAELAATALR